jgi:hypothetical protein
MAYEAYDPRDDIRAKIGTNRYDFDREESYYTIDVVDDDARTIHIPMYDREEVKSGEQPNLPFISMALAHVINEPHDVRASTRKFIAYIDIDVAYVATDNINIKDFGKKIKNELHDKIRAYQETTNGVFFMNIDDERYIDETNPRQMVFHYILTLQCIFYDVC